VKKKETIIYDVSAETIISAAELYDKLAATGSWNKNTVAKALGISITQASKIIRMVEALHLHEEYATIRGVNADQKRIIFRKKLQKYPLFEEYVYHRSNGDSPEDAARKAVAIYQITMKPEKAAKILERWAKYAQIDTNKLSQEKAPNEKLLTLINALDDELRAKVWVRKILGEDIHMLEDDTLTSIVTAIVMANSDPKRSIEKMREYLEDALRDIAKTLDVKDLDKANGPAAVAQKLRGAGKILKKHLAVIEGLSQIGAMAHHGKDKETNEKWVNSQDAAVASLYLAVVCIRSVIKYITDNKQYF